MASNTKHRKGHRTKVLKARKRLDNHRNLLKHKQNQALRKLYEKIQEAEKAGEVKNAEA